MNCTSLESITLPNTVNGISESAFEGCTSLSVVELPSKVSVIKSSAFRHCPIQSIVLPDSIRQIGFQSFEDTQISSLVIPAGVNEVECSGIPNLESITVEEGNPYFDSRDNCNAIINTSQNKLVMGCKNTIIPSSVESIDRFAFNGTSLKQITIPETVLRIGNYAFEKTSLKQITIPETVQSVGDSTFDDCAELETITFEGGKIEISYPLMLRNCTSLKTIMVPAKKAKYFTKRINEEFHDMIVEQAPVKKTKTKAKAE